MPPGSFGSVIGNRTSGTALRARNRATDMRHRDLHSILFQAKEDKGAARSHSYIGLPGEGVTKGFTPVREGYDWMVRALLTADPDSAKELRGGVSAASSDNKNPSEN
jgi:hypothetical protein